MIPAIHSHDNQERILWALLTHVPFDGWTFKALQRAVNDCGFEPTDAYRVFSGNPLEALDFLMTWINRQTEQWLVHKPNDHIKIRDKIFQAVMFRLQLIAPYKEALRTTTWLLARPQHMARGLKYMYQTVDCIWYAIGDESTDFNFYTKRATLAAVYSSTLLKWLNDSSIEHMATQHFLNNRLDDIMRIPQIKSRFKKLLKFS